MRSYRQDEEIEAMTQLVIWFIHAIYRRFLAGFHQRWLMFQSDREIQRIRHALVRADMIRKKIED